MKVSEKMVELVKQQSDMIEYYQIVISLFQALPEINLEIPESFRLNTNTDINQKDPTQNKIGYLLICPFSQLHEAREFMRTLVGNWNDTLAGIYSRWGNLGYAQYGMKDTLHQIQAEFKISETPLELTKDGCKWESQSRTSFHFTCPNKLH